MNKHTEKQTDKATARPWKVIEYERECDGQVRIGIDSNFESPGKLGSKERSIASMTGYAKPELTGENRANATFIVRAVNSHEALVEALSSWRYAESLSDETAQEKAFDDARYLTAKALALAEGGEG